MINVLAHHPELGEVVQAGWKSDDLVQIVTPTQVRENLAAVLHTFSVEDLVWERLAPTIGLHGDNISNFSLRWIFGISGYLCVDRVLLLETGLLAEEAREWDFEDPELAYRLHAVKDRPLSFSISSARVFHQLRHSRFWPAAGVAAIARMATQHPIDGWLLWRFMAHEPLENLAKIDDCLDGSAPNAQILLDMACRELAPAIAHDLTIMWTRK